MNEAPLVSDKRYGWFGRFVIEVLRRYASTSSADRIFGKYGGLPKDVVADRYIRQQARVAGLAGAVSSLVITGGTALSGASLITGVGIPALAITIPVGIAAFGAEMAYTLRLQVRAAYDLCLLYGVPLNADDPEDLWDIFLIAMGIQGGESIGRAIQQLIPKITQGQLRRLLRTGLIRRKVQAWVAKHISREIARRYLAEGFLLKVAVPGVSVVLGAGWNYLSTIGIGRAVKARVRGRGMSAARIDRLVIPAEAPPELILATAVNALTVNRRIHENGMAAYKQLSVRLQEAHPDFDPQNLDGEWVDRSYWFSQVAAVQDVETQEAILAVAETIVTLDGRISRAEAKLLRRLNRLFGFEFDRRRIKMQAEPFYVRPPGRSCRLVALGLAVIVGLSSLSCLVLLILLALGWINR